MTTVAYRDGVLAADTLISYGSFSNGNINKINVVAIPEEMGMGSKVMVAMTGVCWAIQPMVAWIEGGASQDDIPHCLLAHCTEFMCLMITEEGTVYEFNNGYFLECGVEYHAIGSGAMFALGAMAAGIDAPESVEAAMKHDKATGGSVTICTIADLKMQEAA